MKPLPSRKLDKKVPLIDCFTAPCRNGCPIEQDIPAYLMLVNAGKYGEALEVITHRNALPFITGTICPHHCGDKCMRNAYEESVYIRTQKLKAAEGGFRSAAQAEGGRAGLRQKVAVIGGGPVCPPPTSWAAGVDVTIFERKDSLGGIVRHVIPAFRIPASAIDNDVKLMEAMGAKVVLNTEVKSAQELFDQGYTHVILPPAWNKGSAGLEYGEEMNVIEFLEKAKKAPESLQLGRTWWSSAAATPPWTPGQRIPASRRSPWSTAPSAICPPIRRSWSWLWRTAWSSVSCWLPWV